MGIDLTAAVVIGVVLLIVFVLIRVVLKITHMLFTFGCLAVIVLAVAVVLFSGLGHRLVLGG